MRIFFATLFLLITGSALQAQHQFRYLDSRYNPLALSPDGSYICGIDYGTGGEEAQAFLTDTETLTTINLSTGQSTYDYSNAYGVNNAGMVAGSFRDHNYTTNSGIPVTTAGIYKDGSWIALEGVETLDYRNFSNPDAEGSQANAISEDGKMLAGCLITNSILTPCVWIYSEEEEKYIYTPYSLPEGIAKGTITGISADGSIACGYILPDNGDRQAIYWYSADDYTIIPEVELASANAISSDGKVIALDVIPENNSKLMGGYIRLTGELCLQHKE